jgi:hypothetical protein
MSPPANGKREQLIGNIKAYRLRGFDIQDQLELGRLFNRQIGRFCPSGYPVNVFGYSLEHGGKIRSVGHQATRICKFTHGGHRCNSMLNTKFRQALPIAIKRRGDWDYKNASMQQQPSPTCTSPIQARAPFPLMTDTVDKVLWCFTLNIQTFV